MKHIILAFLMLIGVVVNAATIEISGNHGVVELISNNTYIVKGDSKIQNLNWNGTNVIFEVDEGVTLQLGTLNVNNKGTFSNRGTVIVSGWIDLNSIKDFYSSGKLKSAGFQNNTKIPAQMCGEFETGSIQFNNAGIESPCCLFIKTGHLDVNSKNVLSGIIHIYIVNSINLNNILTSAKNVTYKYNKSVNTPKNWGTAQYIDETTSMCVPLPVKLAQFEVKEGYLLYKFTEIVDVKKIEIEHSKDGKNWVVIEEIKPEINKLYKLNIRK